jgi:hypothetical protein
MQVYRDLAILQIIGLGEKLVLRLKFFALLRVFIPRLLKLLRCEGMIGLCLYLRCRGLLFFRLDL